MHRQAHQQNLSQRHSRGSFFLPYSSKGKCLRTSPCEEYQNLIMSVLNNRVDIFMSVIRAAHIYGNSIVTRFRYCNGSIGLN
jgi:hypothetical protein